MKKTLIIIVLLSIVLVVTYVYISQIDTTVRKDIILKNGSLDSNITESINSLSDDEFLESSKITRSEIKGVVESKEYKKSNVNKRIELIDPVILSLYERGYISYYEYKLDILSPNVTYQYSRGGWGVIFFE